MKKIGSFFCSMWFGLILLGLIAACSGIGSLLPQGKEIAWYAQTYRGFHGAILLLGLNHVFEGWFFILLLGLLCVNLTLCSVVRIRSVARSGRNAAERAAAMPVETKLTPEGLALLRGHMESLRCKAEMFGEATVYHKNAIGRYGTFITHLAILLTVIFSAAALYLPEITDEICLPGEHLAMADGTEIHVDGFSIENDAGELDYASVLRVVLPDGRTSGAETVRVNHPMSFGPYKIYQQTYGTAGSVTVKNLATGGTDNFVLMEECFLSIDSVNGLWFEALYPGYLRAPDGSVTLITHTAGRYEDPVYQVLLASEGVYTPTLGFPGDSVRVGDIEFTFNKPVEYPGLRIKRTPVLVNALLIAGFVLMTAGLFITFFLPPVLVRVGPEGYAVGGPKPEGLRMELALLLGNHTQKGEND